MDHTHYLTYHAITLKFFPLAYAIIAFFAFTPMLDDYIFFANSFDPYIWFIGLFMLLTGAIFFYEVGMALPERHDSPSSGITAAVITAIIAGAAVIFAILILTGLFFPSSESNFVNWIFAIVIIASIIMYVVQGREEFFHSQRFLKRMMGVEA